MKAVILAGGLGTRLSEETNLKPKPMVEIGRQPILWHILKHYSKYNINEFIICLGYKGVVIKEYFANYFLHTSDVTFDLSNNSMTVHKQNTEAWRVTLIDTGLETMTGGRLKQVAPYLENEDFCFTYGDGVSDLDIAELVKFHKSHGKLATVTAVNPTKQFGVMVLGENDVVSEFKEKPQDGNWVNGGFFVLSAGVFDYIDDDSSIWEQGPLQRLSQEGQLVARRHTGFWYSMDTHRDVINLNQLWASGSPAWKHWD